MTKIALAKSPASAPSPMIMPYFSPNSLALKSLPTFKFLMPSVEQNLPIANGRSIEITLSLIAALAAIFSLNLRVSVAQTSVSSDGNGDSAVFITGMMAGAAIAHNFALAASPKGITEFAPYAVVLGLVFCVFVGFAGIKKNV